jgi:hypothetical protein
MDISWTGGITIAAPVERVYAYLADFPRHAEWAQSVQRLRLVRPGDARGVGAVYRTAERQGWQDDRCPRAELTRGVPGDTICEVRELAPHSAIAWRSWAPYPGVRHEGDFRFLLEEVAGGTRLTQAVSMRDNWLGDLVSRFVFKTTPQKAYAQWQASLHNIRLILEGQPAAAVSSVAIMRGGEYVA